MFRTKAAVFAVTIVAAQLTPMLPAAPAMADPNPAIERCDELLPSRPESNAGECRSYITVVENGSGGEVAHHCDSLEENDPETFDMFFTSKSECIQAFGGRGKFN
jgi:hypothetical protein